MPTQMQETDLRAASTDDLRDMGLPPNFTLDELTGFLSEEEVKALQDGEDPLLNSNTADEGAKSETVGDEDGDEDGADAEGEDGQEANDEGEGAAPSADAGDGQSADESVAQVDAATFVEAKSDTRDPVFAPVDVLAAKAIVDGAAAERKALRAKFDDGEMSDDEFDDALDKLTDKVANARADIRDAERANEAQIKAYQDTWYSKTDAFMTANPAFRNNDPVPELGGHSTMQVFDAALRRITADTGLAGLSMDEKINRAARMAVGFYKQETGRDLFQAPAATKRPAAAQKLADKAAGAKASADKVARPDPGQRPPPVRTLAGLSAASEVETDDGRFAAIDRASGLDREREFSRMSEVEKDAYLRGL